MPDKPLSVLRSDIIQSYLADENEVVDDLITQLGSYDAVLTSNCAKHLVNVVRAKKDRQSPIEAFLREYQLCSQEGIVLMGMAEALLRIPDSQTQDQFLQEKLTHADWQKHLHHIDSLLVNLSSQALLLTRQIEERVLQSEQHWFSVFGQLLKRIGTPLIRTAIKRAMAYLSEQFVFAESIEIAVEQIKQEAVYRHSFDMLGEAA